MEIWRKKAQLKSFNPYVRNCMWVFRKEESSILKYTYKTKCRGFKEGKVHLGTQQRENWGKMSPWLTVSLPFFLIFHFLWSILFLTCLFYRRLWISMKCTEGQNFKIDIVLLAGGCLRQTQLLSADHHTTTVPDISSYEMIRCRNFKATRTLEQPMAAGYLPRQQVAFMKHIKRREL